MDAIVPMMAEKLRAGELTLRVLRLDDLDDLHGIFSDAATHTIGDGPVKSIQETSDWLQRRDERRKQHGVAWYAIRRANGALVGNAGLFIGRTGPHPELGFEVRRADQGQGYGGAAAAAVVAEAHRTGFPEVWATVREWNTASLHALARIGFERNRVEPDARGSLVYLVHRAR
ncbi:GNAT family N-acetyltransferase [Brachybacterium alimentarium]|uniref:GNAT family N-acetyltransferase n=1 Tax=Brachybacterium alimentarium TaxID=47845 RepID=UPI003FCFEBA7